MLVIIGNSYHPAARPCTSLPPPVIPSFGTAPESLSFPTLGPAVGRSKLLSDYIY